MKDVANVPEGWEIECAVEGNWFRWDGTGWSNDWTFRARSRQHLATPSKGVAEMNNDVLKRIRDQLTERDTEAKLLRDALGCVVRHGELSDSDCDKYQLYCEVPRAAIKAGRKTLAATEPKEQVTNTRRRNADDMGNPPANASELLNAWKPKP